MRGGTMPTRNSVGDSFDEKNASLTLKLKTDSGYSLEHTERISANQWAAISAILEQTE